MIKTQGFHITLPKVKWAKRDPLLVLNIKSHTGRLYVPQYIYTERKYTEIPEQQLFGGNN